MGLLAHALHLSANAAPGPLDDYWYQPAAGAVTPSGLRVNGDEAKKISAWFRGREILACTLAMLPLPLLEKLPDDGGSQPAKGNPLYDVLHDTPNIWQDSFQWRRQMMYHLIDHGNAYCFIVSGPRGYVDQLQPIHPKLVTPKQIKSGPNKGRIIYTVRDETSGTSLNYTQDEIFHLRGASDDGVVGKGILEYARTSIGTALAVETYAGAIFGKGVLNGGTVSVAGLLNNEASKRMAKSMVTAAGDWAMPKVLEQGATWTPNDMSPEDFQMLLSRTFSVDEMARWLGTPRQMLENSDPSFGNADQFDQSFMTYTMGGWLSLWEFGINGQLILNPARFFAQFTRQAFVRGKFSERITGLVLAAGGPIMTRNEARKVEDLNEIDDPEYDKLLTQQNITGKPSASDSSAPSPSRGEAIAKASAARLIRKETNAIQIMARKHASDIGAFVLAVRSFYVDHVDLVTQTLQVSESVARDYCAKHAQQAAGATWLAALQHWNTDAYAATIATLALEASA